MSYIGQLTATASTTGVSANRKAATAYTAGATFTATQMGAFLSSLGLGENVKLGIYSDDTGSPDALLGVTDEITGRGHKGWFHASLTSGVSITSGNDYWLAVIADSQVYIGYNSGALEENADTYSDGFADPYGSSTPTASDLHIYAADETPNGLLTHFDLSKGAGIFETSAGTQIAVGRPSDSSYIVVYKNIDGLPEVLLDSASIIAAHGGGSDSQVHAAIDSNDVIHIVSACTSEQTRDIAYNTISDPDGTPAWGTWEEAVDYTQEAPVEPGCDIDVDSNDYPHIVFVDRVKLGGSTQDNVYYSERTGGTWSSPTKIGERATKTDVYRAPYLTLRNSDYIEVFYYFDPSTWDPAYRSNTGSWGSESTYTEPGSTPGFYRSPIATTGGTVYRYHADNSDTSIKENDADTGYDAIGPPHGVLVDDSDRYIIFRDTGDDIHIIYNTGSGWTDGGAIQTGTYNRVVAAWQYNAHNVSDELIYLFDDGTDVFYGSYSFGTDTSDSQSAYLRGSEDTSDNQSAYLAGGLDTSDSQASYLEGALGADDSQAAYLKGQDTASDQQAAFLAGSLDASDSQQAYLAGSIDVVDSQAAYIKGQDVATDGQPAFLAGGLDVLDSQAAYMEGGGIDVSDSHSAYLAGGLDVSDSQAAHLSGGVDVSDSQAAYLSGGINVSDSQSAYIKGQDTASDSQAAYLSGGINVSDSQSAYIKGQDTASDSQAAYLSGGINVSDSQSAYIKGQDTASDSQAAYLSGGINVSDSQSAYIKGQDTASDSQAAYLSGGINVSSSQAAYLKGQAAAIDSQSAYIKGQDTASDSQAAYLSGGINVSDSQSAYMEGGGIPASDSQSAHIAGSLDIADSKSAYLAGGLNVASNQAAYLAGSINVSDNRAAYLKGQASASDSQAAYLKGQASSASSQQAFIAGSQAAASSQAAYISGGLNVAGSQAAYMAGSLDVSDSQAAYISGGVNVTDSQSAYVKGVDTTSSSKSAYMAVTTFFPLTEDYSAGADEDPWRLSHWTTGAS